MVRNFGGQPRHTRIFHSPSRLTTHVLFSAFLLYLPQHEDHVCGPSDGPEATLALWCVFLRCHQDEHMQQDMSQDSACSGE